MATTVFVVAGGATYSFPSCAVTWDVVHSLFEIPLPKTIDPALASEVGQLIKSLNIVQESFRLVGNWKIVGSETPEARAINFVEYFDTSQEPAVFSWGSITRNVFLKEWHLDEVPGEGDMRRYNIVLSASRKTVS